MNILNGILNGKRKGQVVMVTGASAGVGRATVREFAKRGASIGLIARNEEALRAAQDEVHTLGGKALVLPLDVSDPDAVEDAASKLEAAFGPMDVWVNNAMTSVFSPVAEMRPDEYRRVTEVTYLGYVYGTLSALSRMRPRNHGTIVQVGSALAHRSIPLQSAYCGAKHAIDGFTEALRTELIHDNSAVRVSVVNLPAINTPQFGWVKSRLPNKPQPVPPIYQPEVAAEAIVWASIHHPRELNLALPTLKAVYGERVIPGLLDHYLARNGYQSQQTDEPADPNRPDNLWEPLPGDRGAHGAFGAVARDRSASFDLRKTITSYALVGTALLVTGGVLAARRANGKAGLRRLQAARA